jgi:CHAT domain-containing protein/Tfp pilus assembly protein PilF
MGAVIHRRIYCDPVAGVTWVSRLERPELNSVCVVYQKGCNLNVAPTVCLLRSSSVQFCIVKRWGLGHTVFSSPLKKLRNVLMLIIKPHWPALALAFLLAALCLYRSSTVVRAQSTKEDELAARIVAAATEQERRALVDANKGLVTVELDKALLARANALWRLNRYPQALTIFLFAKDTAAKLDDKPGLAGALRGVGVVKYLQGNAEEAMRNYRDSLAIYESIGDRAGIADVQNDVGLVRQRQGRYQEALQSYEDSLKISESTGNRAGAARTLSNIGIVHNSQGSYPEALQYYRSALAIARDMGDRGLTGRILNAIGIVYGRQGDYARALEYFQQSLEIIEGSADKFGTGNVLNHIGLVHLNRGDYLRADEYIRRCLAVMEQIGDRHGAAYALADLGNVQFRQGNYSQAEEYHRRVLKMLEDEGDKMGIANALRDLGRIRSSRGDYLEALKFYQRSLSIEEEIGDRADAAETLGDIGKVRVKQGDYSEALKDYQQSLGIREAVNDNAGVAAALAGLAQLYESRKDYNLELQSSGRAASIAKEIDDPDILQDALTSAGKAYRALGKPDQAREAFREAIGAVEALSAHLAGPDQEHYKFLESRIAPYYSLADLLLDENDVSGALEVAERAKAQSLIEVLRSGRADVTRAMTPTEKDREQEIKSGLVLLNSQIIREKVRKEPDRARIASLTPQLEKTRREFEAFQTALYAAHPELRVQRGQLAPVTLQQCAVLFPGPDTALLEFLVSEQRTTLFVLTSKRSAGNAPDPKTYEVEIKREDLAALCNQFRERLSNEGLGFSEPARKLYDLLLKPAAAELNGKSSIVIVPDGPLWELPFQALQPAPGRFLIQNSAVSYAPSLTALVEMSRPRSGKPDPRARASLIAFGNPRLSGATRTGLKQLMDEDLAPLPAAAIAVRKLGRLYGPSRSKIYIGADATEERLKAEARDSGILHIAAHGIVNNASPMYSQIVLARGEAKDDDGILEAWEVMNLELSADLVVLSACETARGRVGAGEGMIGLSWAFFVAGCPAIVASQWKVEAQATTPLMVEFHRNLLAKMSKAEALRQAQLKLLRTRRYAHPFYWAGFVVMGSGN